jgi:hypothetical protein
MLKQLGGSRSDGNQAFQDGAISALTFLVLIRKVISVCRSLATDNDANFPHPSAEERRWFTISSG